ncbi:hypothetical protein Tco_0453100 [Tanacetum coccineum]
MLAPKGSTYNGRPTFANPMYLKKAQSKKPCLYEIPYDKCDLANLFTPNREETLTLEQESRSKLNKDLVKPYDYIKQNSLYEIFKPPSREYLDQMAYENEIRKKIWRKYFVKSKPHIAKNLDLQYVRLLEKEIDELESNKADFSNIYDLLLQEQSLNTKPSVQQSARLSNTANGNKPKPRNFNQQPRNWPPSMSSCISNRPVNIAEPPRNQKPFLKSKDLACPTCKKCIYSANHDECILKYLSKVNSRASAQKKDAQSHKTTKRYMPVEKKSDSKKHDRQIPIGQKFSQIPIGQKFSPNKPSDVYLKTTPLDLVLLGNQQVESLLMLVLDGFSFESPLKPATTRMIVLHH